MTVILKSTTKGQITVPMSWRKQFDTNQFIATIKGSKLEIEPLIIDKKKEVEGFTVFDAICDNDGRGIKAKELVSLLERDTRKLASICFDDLPSEDDWLKMQTL